MTSFVWSSISITNITTDAGNGGPWEWRPLGMAAPGNGGLIPEVHSHWGKVCYMDSLPLPYFTQTAYPDNRHSPDCMLYCVGRFAIVTPNSLRYDCVFAHAQVCRSYFNLECPKHWNIRGVLSLLSE